MEKIINENTFIDDSCTLSFGCSSEFNSEGNVYHIHPEMELMAMECGSGRRIINEHIEAFENLDVIFVPGNVPHDWKVTEALNPRSHSFFNSWCHFRRELISRMGAAFPEFKSVADFYLNLKQALKVTGSSARKVLLLYKKFQNFSGSLKLCELLTLLTTIYENKDYEFIGSPAVNESADSRAHNRFAAINKLVTEHYSRRITLSEAASVVGMNPTAFCNAFKASTGISLVRFLTLYRLQVAARLLRSTDMYVSQVAYHVGFSDAPHFTRLFKREYKMSPTAYRNAKHS